MDTHRRAARPLAAILAALLALTLPFAAPAPVLAQPPAMDLESLVALALRDNPELAAAQARVSAARHRIPQAKALPDPMVSAGYTNDGLASYTFGKSHDAQRAFGLSQTIPFPGKLIQKGKVAEKDMEALGLQLHALRLGLTARVKELAHELFLAHRSLEILAERAVVLEQAAWIGAVGFVVTAIATALAATSCGGATAETGNAASTSGDSRPPGAGTTITRRPTPATLAGTAFISTEDG